MANPSTRQELADYCLRKLGQPVIEINIDEDQLEDRIDEALQYFQQYHDDAIIRVFMKHQITSTDISNEYITLPDSVISVRQVLPFGGENGSINMFDARYQIHLNDIFDMGHMGNLNNYAQIQQYMTTLNMILNGAPQIRYNRHMDKLFVDHDWSTDIQVDDYIIIDAMQVVDPTAYPDVYNDQWLKRYTTALIKRQWGENLLKFEGMQLPGGVQMNGTQIFESAMQDIERLEEEIRLVWEDPVDFMQG